MSVVFLILFAVSLIGCVAFKISMVIALLIGLIIFLTFAYIKGFRFKAMLKMCYSGVKTISGILITLLLIGMLTASWRASGTIPTIVSYASSLINPSIFIFISFILCCLVSTLTGTAFGTSATMGTICMSIALALNVSPAWTGGAILAGAYFGDRCSPVSTSALLVSTVTETDLYGNVKNMFKTTPIPLILSSGIYILAGFLLNKTSSQGSFNGAEIRDLFMTEFNIHWVALIPAILVVILAICKVNVKLTLLISTVGAIAIALTLQKTEILELGKALLTGFQSNNPELARMIDGGGLLSMLKTCVIITIAACYQGIFKETEMLDFMDSFILKTAKKCGNFFCYFILSIITSMIGCNQTLAIMLTSQLTDEIGDDSKVKALNIENTAVVIAPLIPWSIAGSVPIETVGAPLSSLLFALFLYILPLWELLKNITSRRKR